MYEHSNAEVIMATPAEVLQYVEPSQMVTDAVAETSNTMDAAALLEKWAKQNPPLREYLTEPWLSRACYDAVRAVNRSTRKSVWTAPNYTKGGNGSRVVAHGRSLLDFPLPGGLPLRHAKKADLEEAARFYREQADDMASKAVWLERIAAKVGRKKVESVFDAEKLAALKE